VHIVLAQPIALVAGVDDERVIQDAFALQVVEYALDVVVYRRNAAKVFVDEMLVGKRTTLSRVVSLFADVVFVYEVKTFRPFLVVHDGEMFALEQGTGLGDVLVQAGWLGELDALVQLGPSLWVLELLVRPLEVQAQVKRFFGVALLEPLERPVGVAIGVVTLILFAGAVGQGSYFNPTLHRPDGTREKYEGYYADRYADWALKWLKQRDTKKPFYLSLHFKGPHE
jgi:hypothetical protein